MTKEETKQTVEEAAIEARMASAETLTTYGTHTSLINNELIHKCANMPMIMRNRAQPIGILAH